MADNPLLYLIVLQALTPDFPLTFLWTVFCMAEDCRLPGS